MFWLRLCAPLFLFAAVVACSSNSSIEQTPTAANSPSPTAKPTGMLAASPTPATASLPDGRTLAYVGKDGGLWMVSGDSEPQQIYLPRDGFVYVPEWSPDGEKLAFTEIAFANPFSVEGYADVMSIVVVDLTGTVLARVPRALMPHWSPGGTELSFLGEPGVEDVAFGGVPSILNTETDSIDQLSDPVTTYDAPRWEPSGQALSYSDVLQGIYIVDNQGMSAMLTVEGNGYDLFYLAPVWSESGELLAFETDRTGPVTEDSYVVVNPKRGIISRVADDNPGKCGRELWLRDAEARWVPGSSLAVWPVQCPLDVIAPGMWVKDMFGELDPRFIETPELPRGIGYLDISPDGEFIAFGGHGFGLGITEGPFMNEGAADTTSIYVVATEGGEPELAISHAAFGTWRPD